MMNIAIAVLFILSGPVHASSNNAGANGAQFLQLGAGARALGLGDAYGPIAEGPDAIYWNPAGLAALKRAELSYTRTELLAGLHHDFAAYAIPVSALKGTLAASFTHFSQNSLPILTNANINLGKFSPYSDAFALAYAHQFEIGERHSARNREYFKEKWNIPGVNRPFTEENEPWTGTLMTGISMKVINETIYQRRTFALALDAGAIYRPVGLEQLSLSFAMRNFGTKEKFNLQVENLPMEIDVGAAYNLQWDRARLLPVIEAAFPYYGSPYGKVGLEYRSEISRFTSTSLRIGYKTAAAPGLNPLAGLTVGAGARYRRLNLDLGFQPMAQLGNVYRMTLGLSF